MNIKTLVPFFSPETCSLDMDGHSLTTQELSAIEYALLNNGFEAHFGNPVKRLILSNNGINDEGAIIIGKIIESSSSLEEIIISNNRIGELGALVISRSVVKNPFLSRLDISYNSIGDRGAQSMAWAISNSSSLLSMDISFNEIGKVGGGFLVMALRGSCALQSLISHGNKMGVFRARQLEGASDKRFRPSRTLVYIREDADPPSIMMARRNSFSLSWLLPSSRTSSNTEAIHTENPASSSSFNILSKPKKL